MFDFTLLDGYNQAVQRAKTKSPVKRCQFNRPVAPLLALACVIALDSSTVLAAPNLVTQPDSLATNAGFNATFSVAATGTGTVTYQWRFNGTAISGGTNATCAVTSPTVADVGAYKVIVSDVTGSTTSLLAILTIKPSIPATIFDITSYGAVAGTNSDGTPIDNASAVQAAINAANAAGGGVVRVPAASLPFVCGRLTLLSNVKLEVESGAILQPLPYGLFPLGGDGRYDDWLTASGATNIEIGGPGTIDGNGQAWWDAFHANPNMPHRPYLIKFSNCTTLYVHDVTLHNSPMFHLVPSACMNVTIDNVTITASGTNPANTDAIDPSGSNILIENSTLAVGDDDVAVKPQNVFCRNIVIVNCTIGTGHGISVGGQTNDGLDDMLVAHCSMTGTDNGLRLKADASQGGRVQNICYSDIRMTNVFYPIVFYSYYREIGTPGDTPTTGTISPTTYNASPPDALTNSTLCFWKNITIDGLTASGAGGSCIIWGLPLNNPTNAFISGVRLNNVSIINSGSFNHISLYNVYDAQISGTNSIGSFTTYNTLALQSQPQSRTTGAGGGATFTALALGTSGVGPVSNPTYRWYREGVALTNGTQGDGSVVSGATNSVLTLSSLTPGDAGHYSVMVSNSLDAYNTTTKALAPKSAPLLTFSQPASLVVTQSFAAWATAAGLSGPSAAANADPDGDGIVNFTEYALSLSPTTTDNGALPKLTSQNGRMVFRFTQPGYVTDASYLVQSSTNLLNWTPVTPIVESVTATTQTLKATLPSGLPTLFVRLLITSP
jgi:polygalacturonase